MKLDGSVCRSHPDGTILCFGPLFSLFCFEILGTHTVNTGGEKISKGYFCLVCKDQWNESNKLRERKNNSGWSRGESLLRLKIVISSNDLNGFMRVWGHLFNGPSTGPLNVLIFERASSLMVSILWLVTGSRHTLFLVSGAHCWSSSIGRANYGCPRNQQTSGASG